MNRNIPALGFIIGLLLPVIGLVVMYFLWGHSEGFFDFVRGLTYRKGMTSKVLTLSLLVNILPFLYYTTKRLDYTARGIFIATMLYAVLIVLVMFVW